MKMLVQYPSWLGSNQYQVIVKELHLHEGFYIALHHPFGRYDYWTASDLTSGMAIASSISKKFALEKAKKLISEHKTRMPIKQNDALKRLCASINGSIDFKLMERIERKCNARGTTSAKIIHIVSDSTDSLVIKEHVEI